MGTHLHKVCDMHIVTPMHNSSVILGSLVQPCDFKYCGYSNIKSSSKRLASKPPKQSLHFTVVHKIVHFKH